MANSKYTEEQLNFIRETRKKHSIDDTTKIVNAKFNINMSSNSMRIICHRYQFKREYVDGIKVDEIDLNDSYREDIYTKVADIYYKTADDIKQSFRKNKIDVIKFYNFINQPGVIYKRDEFYKMFRSKQAADNYWTKLWESENYQYNVLIYGR